MSASSTVTNNFDTQIPFEGEKRSREEVISQVNGHLWRCIDYREGIFTCTLKDEFNPKLNSDAVEKMNRINDVLYPATEPTPKQVLKHYNFHYFKKDLFNVFVFNLLYKPVCFWIDRIDKNPECKEGYLNRINAYIDKWGSHELAQELSTIDPILEREKFDCVIQRYLEHLKKNFPIRFRDRLASEKQKYQFFNSLGFTAEKIQGVVFFTIPSIAELQTRWKIQKFNNLNLPELTIYSSNGSASDLEFVEAYMHYDVTVSTDIEKIHDYYHLYSVIRLILENLHFYKTQKEAIVKEAKNVYEKTIFAKNNFKRLSEERKISELSIRKLEISLGAAVDFISSYNYFETTINNENDFLKFMTDLWQTPENKKFFQKRLDPEDETIDFTFSELKKLLDLIDNEMETSATASSEP